MPRVNGHGPDTRDLQATIEALETFHHCKLDIVLTVVARPHPVLTCVMTARLTTSLAEGRGAKPGQAPLTVTRELWPVPSDPSAFCSFLYRHLLEMDGQMSREFWAQAALPLL